jgi:peptide/nickel transport system substrate-binding protein
VSAARAAPALLVALALALPLGGCGDDGGENSISGTESARPGEGGTLAFALADQPRQADPLLAADRASQIVSAQVHEPLVQTLTGPFGDVRELPGLARTFSPSGDRTIWRFHLRNHVRFHDGTPFNASAVLANAERWRTMPQGQALLPGLVAADAPRPDLVRFILSGPDPELPSRLSDPRLGLVSPPALSPSSGLGAKLRREHGSGSGPFELRTLAGDRALLVRNTRWWGSRLQLGPALDQVGLPVVPEPAERLELLRSAQVQVADELDRAAVERLRRDPLLTYAASGNDSFVGFERSVRGIEPGREIPQLSGVWLTKIGSAG